MLVAAEIVIVGMALFAIGHGRASLAAGMHHVDFSAASIAPLAAGADSARRHRRCRLARARRRLRRLARPRSRSHGDARRRLLQYDAIRNCTSPARRTASASNERACPISRSVSSASARRLSKLTYRAGARLEIARCSGADVDGISGGVSVHSVDGHVTLSRSAGQRRRAKRRRLPQSNERPWRSARDAVERRSPLARERRGHIALGNDARRAHRSRRLERHPRREPYRPPTGPMLVSLSPNADLTIDASTRDGHISVDGNSSSSDDDSAQRTVRLGAGTGRMTLNTDRRFDSHQD